MIITILILLSSLLYGFSHPPANIVNVKFENMNTFDKLYIINGCGPSSFPNPIRKLLSKNFYSSCAKHDYDYWLGNNKEDKKLADETFKKNMIDEISKHIDGMEIKEIVLSIEEIKKDILSPKDFKENFVNFVFFTGIIIKNSIKIKDNVKKLKDIKKNFKEIIDEEIINLINELNTSFDLNNIKKIKDIKLDKKILKKYINQFKRIISMYTYYNIVRYLGNKNFYYGKKRQFLPSNLNNNNIKKLVKKYNKKYNVSFIFKNKRWILEKKDKEKIKKLLPSLKINF